MGILVAVELHYNQQVRVGNLLGDMHPVYGMPENLVFIAGVVIHYH